MSTGKLLIVLFLVVAALSCEKIIDEDIKIKEPKLTLNVFLNPDSLFSVSVTQSISILLNDTIIYVPNASVKIFENGTFIEELAYNYITKLYSSNSRKPSDGNDYRIEVSATGFPTATADVHIPVPVDIASIDTFMKQNESSFYGRPMVFVVKTTVSNPSNEENFYIFYLERPPFIKSPSVDFRFFSEHILINNVIIELTSDKLFIDYWNGGNNQGIGTSEERYLDGNYFALSDKAFNGKSTSFEFEVQNNNNIFGDDSIVYEMKVLSVNKDYFTFIISESQYNEGGDPFTELASVYSNVKGGYGIVFGSSSSSRRIVRHVR